MAKVKSAFFCQNCGTQYPKWSGQCNACKSWNTLVEERIQSPAKKGFEPAKSLSKIVAAATPLSEIDTQQDQRIMLGDMEFDRVLGGGLVPGSITLVGGEPGIGKSTLLLQIALKLPHKTLYVSGEESQKQIAMRAERLYPGSTNCLVLTETNMQNIFHQIGKHVPELVILDSVQTLQTDMIESSAGSVSQIRACTAELIAFAKSSNIPVILIGHITKDGQIAGPKVLEHMVDTVLQLEGDRHYVFRILRALKNRFGSTAELGLYEMLSDGMREVKNPSEILIANRDEGLSGTAIATAVEGIRPLLIEIQALVSTAVYGTPQRSTTGFHAKRLNMLLAVLEKRAGFRLAAKDVFLNITGGISIDDPAIDLAVISAILSSNANIPIPKGICFAAEVGLAGEIRPVQHIDRRISEAAKLGFEEIYISKNHSKKVKEQGILVRYVANVEELAQALFG